MRFPLPTRFTNVFDQAAASTPSPRATHAQFDNAPDLEKGLTTPKPGEHDSDGASTSSTSSSMILNSDASTHDVGQADPQTVGAFGSGGPLLAWMKKPNILQLAARTVAKPFDDRRGWTVLPYAASSLSMVVRNNMVPLVLGRPMAWVIAQTVVETAIVVGAPYGANTLLHTDARKNAHKAHSPVDTRITRASQSSKETPAVCAVAALILLTLSASMFPVPELAALAVATIAGTAVYKYEGKNKMAAVYNFIVHFLSLLGQGAVREMVYEKTITPGAVTQVPRDYDMSPSAVNGNTAYTKVPWPQVTRAGTHLADLSRPHNMWISNFSSVLQILLFMPWLGRAMTGQSVGIPEQFHAGIRAFSIEFALKNATQSLFSTHNIDWWARDLEAPLTELAELLRDNPRSFIEINLAAQQRGLFANDAIENALYRSGIANFTAQNYCKFGPTSPMDLPDPTVQLGLLVDHGVQAVVTFSQLDSIINNPYSALQIGQISCFNPSDIDGIKANGSRVLAHFANHISLAASWVSTAVNRGGNKRTMDCARDLGQAPTAVYVNHFQTSTVLDDVDEVNELFAGRIGGLVC